MYIGYRIYRTGLERGYEMGRLSAGFLVSDRTEPVTAGQVTDGNGIPSDGIIKRGVRGVIDMVDAFKQQDPKGEKDEPGWGETL
jgi:hypothetical protein